MNFIQDNNIVLRKQRILHELTNEKTIGDEFAFGKTRSEAILESNSIADIVAEFTIDFLAHSFGQVNGGYSSRLSNAYCVRGVGPTGLE